MKKIAIVILLSCLLFLTGCSKYCHSWKGQREFERDKYMCVQGKGGDADTQIFQSLNLGQCLRYEYGWYNCK